MNLTGKAGRRNLQPIYASIVEAYNNNNLNEMKAMAREFVIEMRVDKIKAYKFNQSIDNIKVKDKLLLFVTNLHMQDSKETATR
jgi:hypothetical protein